MDGCLFVIRHSSFNHSSFFHVNVGFLKNKHGRIICWAVVGLAFAAGLGLRLPELARKPMHTDEAVQAAKAGLLFDGGGYRYDPREFHGPTLYCFTPPALKYFSGAADYAHSSENDYRIVPALFGAAAMLWLLLLADGLGFFATGAAALLMALSPAGVYYSRYYIQETLLVFFSLGAIACGWRWLNCEHAARRKLWAVAAGLCLGLMHATKETCVLSWAAMGCGIWFARRGAVEEKSARKREGIFTDAVLALGAGVGVSVLFYSSFFTNARGPLDSILTYGNYFSRAAEADSGQARPFFYYAQLLLWNSTALGAWSEGLIVVLAALGLLTAITAAGSRRSRVSALPHPALLLRRFFVVYTLALMLFYSAISYKTPWCVLSMLSGLIVLAGVGCERIVLGTGFVVRGWRRAVWVGALSFVLLAGALHLGWQAYKGAFKFSSDARNPYAYVHPTADARRLGERIEALTRAHPDGKKMAVRVMVPQADYWPLPWYLRRLEGVGYWSAPPANLDAPVLVVAPEFLAELRLELKGRYQVNAYGLRPGALVWLYVEEGLWGKFLEQQSRRDGR